jgi:integration host factor subunit alpha
MTLTKTQIVEELFAMNIFNKTESAQIIETLFELIKQSLEHGEDVLISGFGKLVVKKNIKEEAGTRRRGSRLLCRRGKR